MIADPRASAVTAWSAHVPGLPPSARLLGWDPGAACEPEDAPQMLGRKRLRYKNPETRIALCAVARLLGGVPDRPADRADRVDAATAVVVASNLGVIDTVVGVTRTLHEGTLHDVSPLDAPNVSPNVIAASVAIWFGFGGPCLQVSSGRPAGLDAIAVGQLLLATRRASRVFVVGVEPAGPAASALMARGGAPLRAAAACVLLEPPGAGGEGLLLDPVTQATAGPRGRLRSTPSPGLRTRGSGDHGRSLASLPARLGQFYAALGVLLVAAAADGLRDKTVTGPVEIACGGGGDGWRTTTLRRTMS